MLNSTFTSRRFALPRLIVKDYPVSINRINKSVLYAEYAVRGAILEEADHLLNLMRTGEELPFKEIVPCNIGNPFAVGKKSMTFPREVLSVVENPALLNSNDISPEARARAKEMIDSMKGGVSAYTPSPGLQFVREHVAEFITERDGVTSSPSDIFLSSGASSAVQQLLKIVITGPNVGILTPYPNYPLYTAETTLNRGATVPYYLQESTGWSLTSEVLMESMKDAFNRGIDVRAMVAINPCNPTGSVLTLDEMRLIISFCEEHGLLLIADEVYQDNIYGDRQFYSFKKVADQMNAGIQIASLHSVSKGFMGECGHRGGYMELTRFQLDIKAQINKLSSIFLCPNSVGQLIVDLMVKPPTEGEAGKLWESEKELELRSLERKAIKTARALNKLPGMATQPADGAMYLFPQLFLPQKAILEAKQCLFKGSPVLPDMMWCLELLRKEEIIVVPGSGFGQVPGTFHFRTTFLPEEKKMDDVIERISNFQRRFMEKYD